MTDKSNTGVQSAQSSTLNAQAESVTATPEATAHLIKQCKAEPCCLGIRFGVDNEGCSGLKYRLDFATEEQHGDHVFPLNEDVAIYVDVKSFAAVKGTRMHLLVEGLNEKIIFQNPQAEDACGCGESFAVKLKDTNAK